MQETIAFPEIILILVGSTVAILLLTALVIFALFTSQKRKFNFRQETTALRNNFEQELLKSQLEIQTQAFETISRELHDNVGTLISIAMVHVRSVNTDLPATAQSQLVESESLLNEALETLRDISKSVHPENITRHGWQQSMKDELARIQRTKRFIVNYAEYGTAFELELDKQVILFRILQESLNNIVKHSSGEHIDVQVLFSGEALSVQIEDDGEGFQEGFSQTGSDGSGLRNMQARAAMLPATLSFEKAKNNGLIVKLLYQQPVISKLSV